jgi:hypothetical protein
VKNFRHMLEARHFVIFTDHKPFTYAFQQKRDKCSPRQFNHLDFVAQFTTDVRHICGQDNVVAEALSRVESITASPSPDALAASQLDDGELRTLLASDTALRLEKQQIRTAVSRYCDKSAGKPRPYIPGPLGFKCSSPSTICLTQVQRQRHGWSHNVSCGQSSRKIVAPGHGLPRPASAPRYPATQSLQWETSRCLQPVSCTYTSTSCGLSQHRLDTGTASQRSTVLRAGQKQFE